ncbi:DUF5813 family protein [Salinirubellus salinus]|jgi:hypothetical protein|uniref:DUF5813 family protein n=1 Tax=Salinirubellus salinus TaxID=1364945 RepID=A0A9E7QZK7_9EURY|nr:DUF5813 family protein [Salinirubellus salinus]UWM52828.1 DUF5813 family protein [Salinirubellus salinus]
MTADAPEKFVRAFDAHDAFERDGEGFVVTTSTFGGRVTAEETDDWALVYSLEVRVPMLSATTEEAVGPAVEEGWFDTFALRLEDAPGAVRQDLSLDAYEVERVADEAVATFEFEWGNADHVPRMTKAMAEYVEGTYVEGIVPGYQYGSPVSELLSSARSSGGDGDGSGDPMPL